MKFLMGIVGVLCLCVALSCLLSWGLLKWMDSPMPGPGDCEASGGEWVCTQEAPDYGNSLTDNDGWHRLCQVCGCKR